MFQRSFQKLSIHIIASCFIGIIFTPFSYSQQKSSSIANDFLSQNNYLHELQLEKFFLHTNKTTYYSGEKIWFKAYIVSDTDNKPSLQTTNLHVNFYTTDKKLISNHLFLVENGTARGEIELSKELQSGKYYIELTTQWNQNFKNNASISSVEVINLTQKNTFSTSNVESEKLQVSKAKDSLDIQFYPNSTILLEGIENFISFAINYNSNPIDISGDIIDNETGVIVAKLKSNQFGMGDFKLYCRPKRTYTAVLNYNGIKNKFAIPKGQTTGFNILKSKTQAIESKLNFIVKTNQKTISSKTNDILFAVLHRNGYAKSIIPIKLKKESVNYSFNLLKSELFKGVNTITIFNKSNEPISEYSFFNHTKEKDLLEVTKFDEEKDSLTLNFNLNNSSLKSNLSVSLLPTNTKMYSNQSSIVSSFLFAPYLEKAHLNLTDFFDSNYVEKNIDLLVKTSVRKNTFLYKKESKGIILHENGMLIKGNVSSNIKDLTNYKVLLSSEENNILLIDSIGASNSFSFSNLLLKHPSKYKLALLNHQGKIIKTGFRISHKLIQYNPNQLLQKGLITLTKISDSEKTETSMRFDSSPPLLLDDSTLLDVVTIKGHNKNKYKSKEEKLEELGIKHGVLENSFSQLHTIDEGEFAFSIAEYLQRIPGIIVVMNYPPAFSIINKRGKGSILGNAPMKIFIDGLASDTTFLEGKRVSDFKAISVNLSGAGLGIIGQGGFVNFYTKNGRLSKYKTVTNKDIYISETEFGFGNPTNYENSKMIYANKLSKEYYGTIGWFPNFIVKPNTDNLLRFYKDGHENIKAIINGMDTEGNLIFKIIDFKSNSN